MKKKNGKNEKEKRKAKNSLSVYQMTLKKNRRKTGKNTK